MEEYSKNVTLKMILKRFNVKTAAELPWSNAACERVISLIKDCIMKLKEEEGIDRDASLVWTLVAKTSMTNRG